MASPCEHSTVNNHTNIQTPQTPPLRLRIQIMIKELSLDCGCARSDHSNILPRHLSSRNIGRRQILGFGQSLAPLEDKCRQHLHTSQTEAVTPALEGEEVKMFEVQLPFFFSPQRLSGREDFQPLGKSYDQHQRVVYGTFSILVDSRLKNGSRCLLNWARPGFQS